MRLRILLVFLTSFLLSWTFFTYLKLADLTTVLEEERGRLLRMNRELSFRREQVIRLREMVERSRIRVFSEREALELLLEEVDRLRESYDLEVTEDLRKEEGSWRIGLTLTFSPGSGRELALRIERLLKRSVPIVDIEGLLIDAEEGKVSLKLSLIQPFLEVKG